MYLSDDDEGETAARTAVSHGFKNMETILDTVSPQTQADYLLTFLKSGNTDDKQRLKKAVLEELLMRAVNIEAKDLMKEMKVSKACFSKFYTHLTVDVAFESIAKTNVRVREICPIISSAIKKTLSSLNQQNAFERIDKTDQRVAQVEFAIEQMKEKILKGRMQLKKHIDNLRQFLRLGRASAKGATRISDTNLIKDAEDAILKWRQIENNVNDYRG